MQFVRRALAAGCCAVILSAGLQAAASEKIVDIDYLKITSDGFVADTLNGVAIFTLFPPALIIPHCPFFYVLWESFLIFHYT